MSSVSRFQHRGDVSEAASVGVRKPWVRWLLYTCAVTVRPVGELEATEGGPVRHGSGGTGPISPSVKMVVCCCETCSGSGNQGSWF